MESTSESSAVIGTKQAKFLVVDSGALIKGVRLERIASEFYTLQEVFQEVRDKQAREFLATFPFEIKVKEPTPEALKRVVEFSKRTGDYVSLSTVDLKIIALTLTLELEMNAGNLNHIRNAPVGEVNVEIQFLYPQIKIESKKRQKQKKHQEDQGSTIGEEDEDESGWITLDNIEEISANIGSQFASAENTKVGCITTDFALQNVLLQMGMHLISVEGLAITKLKQWILKCFSCNKTCRDTEKIFCSACGNNTLWKIPVTIDEDGTITHYHNVRRKVNIRGTKFSLPLPKGGRNNNDLILTEDEYLRRLRKSQGKRDVQPSDADTHFGQISAGKNAGVEVGYGKKNPNVSRKKVGKSNKNKMNLL